MKKDNNNLLLLLLVGAAAYWYFFMKKTAKQLKVGNDPPVLINPTISQKILTDSNMNTPIVSSAMLDSNFTEIMQDNFSNQDNFRFYQTSYINKQMNGVPFTI